MNKLRIIFVHGITPTVINWDFSERITARILNKLQDYGVVSPGASPEEIADIITFERVNYSMIGDDAQLRLMNAYEQETDKLYNFSYGLSKFAGLDKIRRQIITSVADVMVYKSRFWRGEIQQLVVDKISPYVSTGDSVSIIAHSLGSVVAFDTLHENVNHNPQWQEADFRPANLFTMGSPIALFTLDLDRELEIQPPQGGTEGHPDEQHHHQIVQKDGVWYNFLDAQDLIAYPLEILFKDRFVLEDIVVQTGTNPRKAHDGYWDNEEVSDFIAGRLKLDFQRINSSGDVAIPANPTDDSDEQTILERLLDL
jgi:(2Fe-2S) ferredoxin